MLLLILSRFRCLKKNCDIFPKIQKRAYIFFGLMVIILCIENSLSFYVCVCLSVCRPVTKVCEEPNKQIETKNGNLLFKLSLFSCRINTHNIVEVVSG